MLEDLKLYAKSSAGRFVRRVAGPHAVAILADAQEGLFLVGTEDFTIGRRLRMNGAYGAEELARIRDLIRASDSVLVVGAHVGTIAIPLARTVSHLVAFEADPQTYRLLQMNVLLNDATNITVHNLAASDSQGELAFLSGSANSGGNKRLPVRSSKRYTFDRPHLINIPAVRLDDEMLGSKFDLILMDIEGSEVFALRGMQRILAGARTLIVEFIPHHLRDVANVSVYEFLTPIIEHFDNCFSPAVGRSATREMFGELLQHLFDNDISEDGLVFTKSVQ